METAINSVLNKAKNALIVPKSGDKDAFFASLPFLNIFSQAGKNVNLLTDDLTENYSLFLNPPISQFYSQIKIFIKNIRELKIFYEKKDNLNALFLKTKQRLSKNDIEIISLENVDFVISIGNLSINEVETILKEHDIIINQKPLILNIDTKILNENFGDLNYVDINSSSLCELVFDILKEHFPNALKLPNTNSLLAGVLLATKLFEIKKFNSTTLKKFIFLKNQANFNEVLNFVCRENIIESSLLVKMLKNMDFIEKKNLFITNISAHNDNGFSFKNEIINSLKLITQNGTLAFNFLLLLEDNCSNKFTVIFYSPKKELLERVKNLFNGKQKGYWILVNSKEKDEFLKEKILNIL